MSFRAYEMTQHFLEWAIVPNIILCLLAGLNYDPTKWSQMTPIGVSTIGPGKRACIFTGAIFLMIYCEIALFTKKK